MPTNNNKIPHFNNVQEAFKPMDINNPVFTEEEIRSFMQANGYKDDDVVSPSMGKKMFDFIMGIRMGKTDVTGALHEAVFGGKKTTIDTSNAITSKVKVDQDALQKALDSMTEEEKKKARENTIKILQEKKAQSETDAGIEKAALNRFALKTGFGHLYKK